jgi:hypothetical protein
MAGGVVDGPPRSPNSTFNLQSRPRELDPIDFILQVSNASELHV